MSDTIIDFAGTTAPVLAWSGNKHLHIKGYTPAGNKWIRRTVGGITNGGPLFAIPANSSLTLENVTLDGGRYLSSPLWQPNPLVLVQGGTLKLKNGASLQNNQTDANGAGLNMSSGQVIMEDGSRITGNGSPGTGINYKSGAGVFMSGGTFVMEGGEIDHNTHDNSAGGGGVRLNGSGGEFDMRGGTIANNSAGYNVRGPDIYCYYGTFKMSGTAVIGPPASGTTESFYLNGTTIQITGTLTGTAPVATIRPDNASAGTAILSGDPGLVSMNYSKFALDSGVTGVSIGSDGRLQ
jgi:hypothetical protein